MDWPPCWRASQFAVTGAEGRTDDSRSAPATVGVSSGGVGGGGIGSQQTVIKEIGPVCGDGRFGQKEIPWLGVSTEEAPEVLAAQLGLDPGVGLVVTWVATNSPAAKAGLHKNDVLVEFDGQSLVHPEQLRKLVRVRKEGDVVKLVFCRAGKKQTVSVTLAKTITGFFLPDDVRAGQGFGGMFRQFGDLGDAYREQLKALEVKLLAEQLGNMKIDQRVQRVQEEIRRSLGEARKACREALRHATNANSTLGPILESLAKAGVFVNNDASVTVRSSGESAKSLVKADESGTIVIVSNPKLHLTAHDKDGNLLFDGVIDAPEQRAKVPRGLWNKVEPLLEKMTPPVEEEPETEPTTPSKEMSSMCASGCCK